MLKQDNSRKNIEGSKIPSIFPKWIEFLKTDKTIVYDRNYHYYSCKIQVSHVLESRLGLGTEQRYEGASIKPFVHRVRIKDRNKNESVIFTDNQYIRIGKRKAIVRIHRSMPCIGKSKVNNFLKNIRKIK